MAGRKQDGGRVLLLSPADLSIPKGGRGMLSRTNLILLRRLLGERLTQLCPESSSSPPIDAWRGYVDGVNQQMITSLLSNLARDEATSMFVDGSNYGAAVSAVKRHAPWVRIITFFHNVEARFFWGALCARRTPKSVAVLASNYVAERQAALRSDVLVTLTERDSIGLRRLYGRGADTICPIVLEDRALRFRPPIPIAARPYVLFVGGGFYANLNGIKWFVRDVVPKTQVDVKVVGRGLSSLIDFLGSSKNVELIGEVDDLEPWYAGASLVIAPIFDGSGMKTKVAEALMFGKRVAGTPEAFRGYAKDVVAANDYCTNAAEFVSAVKKAVSKPINPWDAEMRRLYDRDHSLDAGFERLSSIIYS